MSKNNRKRQQDEEEEDEQEEQEQQGTFSFGEGLTIERKTGKEIIADLPQNVADRVRVLRTLQSDHQKLRKQYEVEFQQLIAKYENLYKPLYTRRSEIIQGTRDVEEQELKNAKQLEDEEAKTQETPAVTATPDSTDNTAAASTTTTTTTTTSTPKPPAPEIKGVPEFWYKVINNSELAEQMLQPHDDESLKFLQDVTATMFDDGKNEEKSKGFHIDFIFATNPFFENTSLRKTYYLDPEDGVSIEQSEGCEIKWKEGKNLTVKIVMKKQKHKSGNRTRKVKKEEPQESFYNFFKTPPEPEPDADEETLDDYDSYLEADFEMGQIIKERIIPSAVDYYCGESLYNMESAMQYMNLGADDDDEEEQDDDDDEEEEQPRRRGGRGGRGRGGRSLQTGGGEQPECKQQ